MTSSSSRPHSDLIPDEVPHNLIHIPPLLRGMLDEVGSGLNGVGKQDGGSAALRRDGLAALWRLRAASAAQHTAAAIASRTEAYGPHPERSARNPQLRTHHRCSHVCAARMRSGRRSPACRPPYRTVGGGAWSKGRAQKNRPIRQLAKNGEIRAAEYWGSAAAGVERSRRTCWPRRVGRSEHARWSGGNDGRYPQHARESAKTPRPQPSAAHIPQPMAARMTIDAH
jgi:hypothetical protein